MIARLLPWLDLMRAHSALGGALAVWVGGRLAGAAWHPLWLYPMAIAFLLSAAGNVINDAHDAPVDRVNRPERPIPRGAIRPAAARLVGGGFLAVALGLALPLGPLTVAGTALAVGLLLLYSPVLKSIPLVGNGVVGLLTGMALGFGGLLAGNVPVILAPAAALTLLFTGREILKTIHDLTGDRQFGIATAATRWGAARALVIAGGLMAAALPLITLALGPVAALAVALPLAALLLPLLRHPTDHPRIARSLRWSKALGLVLLLALALAPR